MQTPGSRGGQITGAVFLIGLGILFAFGWFWPGILYLLGVTAIVGGATEGKPLSGSLQGGLFLIGLGLVFTLGFSLPLLLIILGLITLFGIGGKIPFMPPMMGGDRSEWRAQREAAREQRRAWKAQYRTDRRALKDQYRYGPGYMPAEKMKNDQIDADADEGGDQDDEFTLGDDGELIKVKNDQRRSEDSRQ